MGMHRVQKSSRKGKDKAKKDGAAKVIAVPVDKPRRERGAGEAQVRVLAVSRELLAGAPLLLSLCLCLVRAAKGEGAGQGGVAAGANPEKQKGDTLSFGAAGLPAAQCYLPC